MKRILIGFLLVFLLVGCTAEQPAADDTKESKEDTKKTTVDIKTDQGEVHIETTVDDSEDVDETGEEPDVEVTTINEGTGDWCPEGGEWAYAATAEQGDVSGEWEVIGLETSGEYAGLCHVKYKVNQAGQEINVEYWFEEGGQDGYMKMNAGGQEIVQEWHSE